MHRGQLLTESPLSGSYQALDVDVELLMLRRVKREKRERAQRMLKAQVCFSCDWQSKLGKVQKWRRRWVLVRNICETKFANTRPIANHGAWQISLSSDIQDLPKPENGDIKCASKALDSAKRHPRRLTRWSFPEKASSNMPKDRDPATLEQTSRMIDSSKANSSSMILSTHPPPGPWQANSLRA
ncbi:hypothetical protein GX51_01794 [Blastomyces parvus]|uniref:Uncharacterized protein n=1 Tax=Blastomyces parvus TaxID=2060905 RepID=A0A2B7XFG0_9EURO|nr:hypothetical protein GX51_01794 [Blastomyces parvus]